jgi:hypothetical protein
MLVVVVMLVFMKVVGVMILMIAMMIYYVIGFTWVLVIVVVVVILPIVPFSTSRWSIVLFGIHRCKGILLLHRLKCVVLDRLTTAEVLLIQLDGLPPFGLENFSEQASTCMGHTPVLPATKMRSLFEILDTDKINSK